MHLCHNGVMESYGTAPEHLSGIIEHLTRRLREESADMELSSSWATTLSRLDLDGAMGVSELARREGISQPGMTQLVDRIAKEGLVEKTVSATDRRVTLIALTEAGRTAMVRRRQQRVARMERRIAALSAEEQQLLVAALPALDRLARAWDSAPHPSPGTSEPSEQGAAEQQ